MQRSIKSHKHPVNQYCTLKWASPSALEHRSEAYLCVHNMVYQGQKEIYYNGDTNFFNFMLGHLWLAPEWHD